MKALRERLDRMQAQIAEQKQNYADDKKIRKKTSEKLEGVSFVVNLMNYRTTNYIVWLTINFNFRKYLDSNSNS